MSYFFFLNESPQITPFILSSDFCSTHASFEFSATILGHLYTAPELLRQADHTRKPTIKGDVYAFSIILQEILQRNGPYGNTPKEPKGELSFLLRIFW